MPFFCWNFGGASDRTRVLKIQRKQSANPSPHEIRITKNGADFLFSALSVRGYRTLETPFLSSAVSWGGYVENGFLAEK